MATFTTWVDAQLTGEGPSTGMGYVLVLRKKGGGTIEAGAFLVDPWCCGVRDAFFSRLTESELAELLERMFLEGRVERDGAWGRKFIESAVAYARKLGFAPHSDYKKAARVFGGLRVADCPETFVFGKDGKPFYVQGRGHDERTAQRVVARLRKLLGDDHFDFLIEEEDVDEAEEEEDGPRFMAEQSGGGEPRAEWKTVIAQVENTFDIELAGDLAYRPEEHAVADLVLELIDALLGVNPASAEESVGRIDASRGELRRRVGRCLFTLLTAYVLDMENLLSGAVDGVGPEAAKETASILEAVRDPEMRELFQTLTQPEEGISRRFFALEWSDEEVPRLLLLFGELEIDP